MGYNVHILSAGDFFREKVKKAYTQIYPDRVNANLADIEADETFALYLQEIDEHLDESIAELGRDINTEERPNDVYIIDSRLAWHNIPNAYAVRLTVNEKIAGMRVFNDKNRGSEDQYETLEDAIEKTRKRKHLEIERYKEIYEGIDIENPDNFDLIIDTSYSNTQELAEIIIEGEKAYREEEKYPKNWASPLHFLPNQPINATCTNQLGGYTIEELIKNIKDTGYDANLACIEISDANGVKFIEEGHHRVMATIATGRTLIPYEIIHKNDEIALSRRKYNVSENGLVDNLYDHIDIYKYYGGKIGNLEIYKNLKEDDFLSINKIKEEIQKSGEDR